MYIYELSHIGQFHTNHNEDYLTKEAIGANQLLIAVMDGCSSGTDSHFASTLTGKVLRKIAKDLNYQEFAERKLKSNATLLKEVLRLLFSELAYFNSRLDLKSDELLSTIVLGIVDTAKCSAEIFVIGDGQVVADGVLTDFEQDNKPDYICYHLAKDFESWLAGQQQCLSIESFNDLSISTDGIYTFKKFDTDNYPPLSQEEINDLFCTNREYFENENMLKKKLILIEKEFGLKPSDDLSIIRLLKE